MTPDPRHRRPHSRQGRTAQTRKLQKIRRAVLICSGAIAMAGEPPPPTFHVRDLVAWYRIRHRRDRKSARRAEHWRLLMLDRRVQCILRGWGEP